MKKCYQIDYNSCDKILKAILFLPQTNLHTSKRITGADMTDAIDVVMNSDGSTGVIKCTLDKTCRVIIDSFDSEGWLVMFLVNTRRLSGYYSVSVPAAQWAGGAYAPPKLLILQGLEAEAIDCYRP